MTYLTIDDTTDEGKALLARLKRSRAVKILKHPNEETRQALRDAKDGKGVKKINSVSDWFNKNFGV